MGNNSFGMYEFGETSDGIFAVIVSVSQIVWRKIAKPSGTLWRKILKPGV